MQSDRSSDDHDGKAQDPAPLPPYVENQNGSAVLRHRRPKVDPTDPNVAQVPWPPITYPQHLMSVARSFIDDQGQFGIAVVVVHMACEVATQQKLSEGFRTKGIPEIKKAVTAWFSGYNMGNDKIRKLYVALTGDNVHEESFWPRFKDSAKLRNRIVHSGPESVVKKAEAETSYRAAREFLIHLGFSIP